MLIMLLFPGTTCTVTVLVSSTEVKILVAHAGHGFDGSVRSVVVGGGFDRDDQSRLFYILSFSTFIVHYATAIGFERKWLHRFGNSIECRCHR